MYKRASLFLLLLGLFISSCGSQTAPEQEPPSDGTSTLRPTAFLPVTLTPSLTPVPTWTNTPTITPTFTPTKTLKPSKTPTPLPTATPTPISPLSKSLKEFANRNGKHIGSLIRWKYLESDPNYRLRFLDQFDLATINGFCYTSKDRSLFNFAKTDELVDFARKNGFIIRGQSLVYNDCTPGWMNNTNITEEDARAILKEYVQGIVKHYKGSIDIWIVANELIDDNGMLRQNMWYRTIGPQYIDLIFRWAHQADPKATLLYNDYHLERPGKKANAVFRMLRQMIQNEVPIDGVGFQLHLELGSTPDLATLQSQMQRFAKLGLIVDITELDVRLRAPYTIDRLGAQADAYETVMQACLNITKCKNFSMWDFTDAHSWVDKVFPGYGSAHIFDENYNPKPAFDSLIRIMRQQ